jgi:hypothetical protein
VTNSGTIIGDFSGVQTDGGGGPSALVYSGCIIGTSGVAIDFSQSDGADVPARLAHRRRTPVIGRLSVLGT